MPCAVKADEGLGPVDVNLFGAQAAVHEPQPLMQLIQDAHRLQWGQMGRRKLRLQILARWQSKRADWHHDRPAAASVPDESL